MLYNVSATIICSLVYLICSHKGIRYHGVQVFVRTPIPSRGATSKTKGMFSVNAISIHAPLAGSDQAACLSAALHRPFQSTLPSRGATGESLMYEDQSYISIHAPLAGSDHTIISWVQQLPEFQSTLPSRGATIAFLSAFDIPRNFNPRSPRGERQFSEGKRRDRWRFQSTLPSRGATILMAYHSGTLTISIHAPLAGSDNYTLIFINLILIFQSTLPSRGATKRSMIFVMKQRYFNPRSPRGERPLIRMMDFDKKAISIHAPLAGSDDKCDDRKSGIGNFNPRSPRGERRCSEALYAGHDGISIHAPLAGSDLNAYQANTANF